MRLRALVALLALAAIPVLAGPVYTITSPGTLIPGSWSEGHGISNAGQVVGVTGSNSPGNPTAITWTPPGPMTGLAPLPTGTRGDAHGVNNSGQVAGTSNILVENPNVVNGFYDQPRATVWNSSGEPTSLGAFTSDPNSRSAATAINSSGVVVGYSAVDSSSTMHGFVWPGTGAIQDIGTLTGGSWSRAEGINSAGDIVGLAGDSSEQTRGFVRLAGETTLTALAPFGADAYSEAYAINDSGQIAGVTQNGPPFVQRGVRWVNGTPELLGSLNSSYLWDIVHGINNSNSIVGASMVDADNWHAVLWADGVLYDLNDLISDPNWTLMEAYAINDSGQIVGYGSYSTGVGSDGPPTGNCDQCAFLLTPADSDIPEPSTAALGALGALGLAALAIFRRLAA